MRINQISWGLGLALVWNTSVIGQVPPAPEGIFFQDAFTEGLVGSPPQAVEPSLPPAPVAVGNWSQAIRAEVLEDEVKSVVQAWYRAESGGKPLPETRKRRYIRYLAVLFGVISEYDGEMRWKSDAPEIWQSLLESRAGAHGATVSAEPFYALLSGGRWEGSPDQPTPPAARWKATLDRGVLMRRLESALDKVWDPLGKDAQHWRQRAPRARHDAEIAQMVSRLLVRDDMPDAGDTEYAQWCRDLQAAARRMVEAVNRDDRTSALEATRQLRQSCDQCHQAYRG